MKTVEILKDLTAILSESGNEKEIEFTVKNSIPSMPIPGKAGGIGLQNLERRLELLYPNRHQLNISRTNDTFVASLKLSL